MGLSGIEESTYNQVRPVIPNRVNFLRSRFAFLMWQKINEDQSGCRRAALLFEFRKALLQINLILLE